MSVASDLLGRIEEARMKGEIDSTYYKDKMLLRLVTGPRDTLRIYPPDGYKWKSGRDYLVSPNGPKGIYRLTTKDDLVPLDDTEV